MDEFHNYLILKTKADTNRVLFLCQALCSGLYVKLFYLLFTAPLKKKLLLFH